MLVVSWVGWWQLRPRSRRLEPSPGLTWALLAMSFSGWVAVVAGWYTTEIGRQPWLVQGVLSTAQAAGPVPASSIGLTLAIYLALYIALTAAYMATIFHLARKGVPAEPPRTRVGTLPQQRGARPA